MAAPSTPIWARDQFVAALYTETAHNNPQVIQTMDSEKRMEVRMLNNYSKRRWINSVDAEYFDQQQPRKLL